MKQNYEKNNNKNNKNKMQITTIKNETTQKKQLTY